MCLPSKISSTVPEHLQFAIIPHNCPCGFVFMSSIPCAGVYLHIPLTLCWHYPHIPCNPSSVSIIHSYGQATTSKKQMWKWHRFIGFIVFPLYLPHQVKTISLLMSLAVGYRTHFTVISWAKLLLLSLWCGLTITLNSTSLSLCKMEDLCPISESLYGYKKVSITHY